jgi:glycosyltransferase involved in cell wall biosynthesis
VKVLHIGKFYPPAKGGMETVLASICEKTSGHVVNRVLVANNTTKTVEERHGAVDVLRVGALTRLGAVAVCPTMPAHLARESADLIVIHEPNPMGLLSYFLARPAGRLIVWFHSEVIRPKWRYRLFYRPFLQFALKRASKIVVASQPLAQSAQQLRGWEPKSVVIPYGIEIRVDSDAIGRRAAEIRQAEVRPIVLFVGRLVAYKGADVLLEAVRGIEAVTFFVGDGPERRALTAKPKRQVYRAP